MKNFEETIKTQLDANVHGLEWARVYLKGGQLSNSREQLIRNRINLKRVKRALRVNPAAAVFGESQVGKSYMADCLLTSETSVLNIYDAQGKPTGFLEYINPLGGGKEATSLISRFTVQKVWVNDEYPIRVEMLTPVDVVTIIVDTYFNDVVNHTLPRGEEIKAEIERLKNTYGPRDKRQDVITEDEIFELKEYFNLKMMERGESFRESLLEQGYFDALSNVISKVDVSEFADVFSYLWNGQPQMTRVFSLLMDCLRRLDFSTTVYVKLDAVLRSPGTVLHVDRIYELFGLSSCTDSKGNVCTIVPAAVQDMEVLTEKGNAVKGVKKSEFCALAMEIAFTITDTTKGDGDAAIVKEKPFLKNLDILDFPGARSRKMIDAAGITENEACEMMLRGKVAYLFNKYSQQYLISNLLFCHHAEKSEVSTLPKLLKGWVESTVGATPADRAVFMQQTPVPPLFLIGTKFNMDLTKNPDDSKGDEKSRAEVMSYRWAKRFGNLQNLLGSSASWFTEWTPGSTFKNVYLLRSFEYSCQGGLYTGYQTKDENGIWHLVYGPDGRLQGEQAFSDEYAPFFAKLKPTFEANDFVCAHFANPDKSWKEAVEVGRDGSSWIIENLTSSSRNMSEVRRIQFTRVLQTAFDNLVKVLHSFYHDDNSDVELRRQLGVAGSIGLTMDVLFGRDKYFFSDFVDALCIEEEHLHDVVLDVINGSKPVDETDLSVLFAIRAKAQIDPKESYEENKRRLREAYNCATDAELEAKLEALKVTIEDIINPPKVMNFSRLIADAVECDWVSTHLDPERYKEFIDRGLDRELLQSLFANMEVLYRQKVGLSELIAKRIHPYVSASSGSLDEMSDMLADISAEMINSFVNTVGASYYSDEMWDDIRSTVEHNGFDVNLTDDDYARLTYDEDVVRESLPQVFDVFDNVDRILNEVPVDTAKLGHFSNYAEYRKWMDRMKISFLATQGIPKYNVDMNNALRGVLVNDIMAHEALSELVAANPLLKTLSTISAEN